MKKFNEMQQQRILKLHVLSPAFLRKREERTLYLKIKKVPVPDFNEIEKRMRDNFLDAQEKTRNLVRNPVIARVCFTMVHVLRCPREKRWKN